MGLPENKDYKQLVDGVIYEWADRRQDIACCDCGLVHSEEIWVKDGKILTRTRRAVAKTTALRKSLGILKLMKSVLTDEE